ncbi:MAG: histidine kinase [Paucibacter sp.]|nr:histidine kinase [Roseateles sp.]
MQNLMRPALPSPTALAAARQRFSWGFAAVMLAVGLLHSMSELQQYRAGGGQHAWEPFLWELSSTLLTAVLAPLIYRLHARSRRQLGWLPSLGLHLAGALGYTLLHVTGMFGLRFAVYAVSGVSYEPGHPADILLYEAGKDLVSYGFIVGLCHGLQLHEASRQREQDLLRLQTELAEARLNRLVEQIQPHFLFNTLNLISSVMYEDVPRADRIVCDLATLLRQALTAQESSRHTLAAELALVRPYLAIMQARFGERLQVQVDVDEAASVCLLPSLLLIAPVENAITHDVAHSAGLVQVRVSAALREGRLCLQVANSGRAPERSERPGSVGLSNTRERLRVLYGDAARVRLSADGAGGSLLEIELPEQRA